MRLQFKGKVPRESKKNFLEAGEQHLPPAAGRQKPACRLFFQSKHGEEIMIASVIQPCASRDHAMHFPRHDFI
jgi:hypothetical protein